MMWSTLVLVITVVITVSTVSECWVFEPHHMYHYTYTSIGDTWANHEITTIIKIRIRFLNETTEGLHLNELFVDSIWQRDQAGFAASNPLNWNLVKPFFFTTSQEGRVQFVHYHPEEKEEVLMLKKALANIFTHHQEKHDSLKHTYTQEENDHHAHGTMHYQSEKVAGGHRLSRTHHSIDQVERKHDKVIDFNMARDIKNILSKDNLFLKDRTPEHIKERRKHKPIPGEAKFPEEEYSGPIEEIEIKAETNVALTHKKPHKVTTVKMEGLTKDTVLNILKKEESDNVDKALKIIHKQLGCSRRAEDKFKAQRQECMHVLVSTVKTLTPRALYEVGMLFFNETCEETDAKCNHNRVVMLDIIGSIDLPEAQRVLTKYVFQEKAATEEEIQHALVHLLSMKNPIPAVVLEVEKICFGDNFELHGAINMHDNQRRACLILGALARNLNATDPDRADQLVGYIESWIMKHHEVHGRRKRDTSVDFYDESGYVDMTTDAYNQMDKPEITRTILLESLGNAGLQRSLPHLKEHLEFNIGTSSWRRAAAHAMRNYKCDESAAALLETAMNDGHSEVRQEAFRIYEDHPAGLHAEEMGVHQEAVIKRHNSSIDTTRDKRSVLTDILDVFNFVIKAPGVKWKKEVGGEDIGASIGIFLQNEMILDLAPLKGQFKVDVYDDAYFEVHIGIIRFYLDVFRIFVCFKGYVKYDLNILKDFGISEPQELITKFDTVIATLVDPIVDSVDAFIDIIQLFGEKGLVGVFNDLMESTEGLHVSFSSLANTADEFKRNVSSLEGKPWMKDVRQYGDRVGLVMLSIKDDYSYFYQQVANELTITFPNAVRELESAFTGITDAFANILTAPLGVISSIQSALTKISNSMTQIFRGKARLEAYFESGKSPYFMNPDELPLLSITNEYLRMNLQKIIDKPDGEDMPLHVGPGNGIKTINQQEKEVAAMVLPMLERMAAAEQDYDDAVSFFRSSFNTVLEILRRIKIIYRNLKDTFFLIRDVIKTFWGPEAFEDFPKTFRQCGESRCGCGFYPSTTSDDYPPGVQIVSETTNAVIPMPFSGVVTNRADGAVVLDLVDIDMKDYYMEIYNVKQLAWINANGTLLCEGEIFAWSKGLALCQPWYFHVTMRKKSDDSIVNPTPFIKRPPPYPKWKQVCNEQKFTVLGVVIDASELAGDKDNKVNPKERLKKDMNDFKNKGIPSKAVYRPKNPSKNLQKKMKGSFGSSIDRYNNAKAAAKNLPVYTVSDNPLLSMELYSIQQIEDILAAADELTLISQLDSLVDNLNTARTAFEIKQPQIYRPIEIREQMKYRLETLAFSQPDLITKLMIPLKVCPNLNVRIVQGAGNFYTIRRDCLGINTGVILRYLTKKTVLPVTIAMNSCDPVTDGYTVTVSGTDYNLVLEDTSMDIDASSVNVGEDMDVTLEMSTKVGDNNDLLLTLSAYMCSSVSATCLENIPIFDEMSLASPTDCEVLVDDTADRLAAIKELTFKNFITEINSAGIGDTDALSVLTQLRITIYDIMRESPGFSCSLHQGAESSFQDGFDFCIQGNIPVKPLDKTFFEVSNLFMVGPLPMKLKFGAGGSIGVSMNLEICILTMKVIPLVTPWAAGKVYGGICISLLVLDGCLTLEGFVMESKLPGRAEIKFDKFPLDISGTLNLELVPLRVILRGEVIMNLIVKKVTVFKAPIWQFKTPPIKILVLEFGQEDDDTTPPQVSSDNIEPGGTGGKRATDGQCSIEQIAGLTPENPQWKLKVFTDDEVSKPKLTYAIGTAEGAEDIKPYQEMGGSPLIVAEPLKDGVPLYWTVKATDDQGLVTTVACSLPTYDMTLPQGRVSWFKYISHRSNIKGNLVVIEDSGLTDRYEVAMGYGGGPDGDQEIPWDTYRTRTRNRNINDQPSALHQYADPREGRLSSEPFLEIEDTSAEDCATACTNNRECKSFDFDELDSDCQLQGYIEDFTIRLQISKKFMNYEKMNADDSWWFSFEDLELNHGQTYVINALVTNVLGYENYIIGDNILVDFTPPEPGGTVGDFEFDIIEAAGCEASPIQRCIDVTAEHNHRIIIDGPGSRAVGNGPVPFVDQVHTKSNHYYAANWWPFSDLQSDIHAYAWAAGYAPCGGEVFEKNDPHSHVLDKELWTFTGLRKDLALPDGLVYPTIDAANTIIYGGALVTTVCHYFPLAIDTTPPIFYEVRDMIYDEYFNALIVMYNVTDASSGVRQVDLGLGLTRHDVAVRKWTNRENTDMEKFYQQFNAPDVDLEGGVPTWIRVRVWDNVDLMAVATGAVPITVDYTPPIAGVVIDGDVFEKDLVFQKEDDKICAQWFDFYDPETGISLYRWSVGTEPEKNDIVDWQELSYRDHKACYEDPELGLNHTGTYYHNILAYNFGVNRKFVKASSNGVTVDVTPAENQQPLDGEEPGVDLEFSSLRATVAANWDTFVDPESDVVEIEANVYVNGELEESYELDPTSTGFIEHTYAHNHQDFITTEILVTNGATAVTENITNGFIIDLTPPQMLYLRDTPDNRQFQRDDTRMQIQWGFIDPETGVKEYRFTLNQQFAGQTTRFYPTGSDQFETIAPDQPGNYSVEYHYEYNLTGIALQAGARYFATLIAVNYAGLSAKHDSEGVTIDPTPPVFDKVIVGVAGKEEELDPDDLTTVLTADNEGIQAAWSAFDPESGIESYFVGVGTAEDNVDMTDGYIDFGRLRSGYIPGLNLSVTEESGLYYYVNAYAVNGAGIVSGTESSKRIKVLRANVPGNLFDGRHLYEDSGAQWDKSSVAVSFGGFGSEACGITAYKWAVGTDPGFSDLLAYTTAGIVMYNETHGIAQDNLDLPLNTVIYVTVAAITGHGCHEDMIVSTSNGIWVDVRNPHVSLTMLGEFENDIPLDKPLFQATDDLLALSWIAVDDESGYENSTWMVGTFPMMGDINPGEMERETAVPLGVITLEDHETVFVTIQANDLADNVGTLIGPPLMIDPTEPEIHQFECQPFLSVMNMVIDCTWLYNTDNESLVDYNEIGIGSIPDTDDVRSFERLNYYTRHWHLNVDTSGYTAGTPYFLTLRSYNMVGRYTHQWYSFLVDNSHPVPGNVMIVTNSIPGDMPTAEVQCQESATHVTVIWEHFLDPHSQIATYHVAIGTFDNPSAVRGYHDVGYVNRTTVSGLAMAPGEVIYATVRGYNGAQLYAVARSGQVVISPYPILTVNDGRTGRDSRYQASEIEIAATWSFSDSCPIVAGNWSIYDIAENNVLMPDSAISEIGNPLLTNDNLQLGEDLMYFVKVTVVDALGRRVTGRSNGIMVYSLTPLVKDVYDGSIVNGEDFRYQEPVDEMYCNWEPFGDPGSDEPGQEPAYYLVAVGNDPTQELTRSNVAYYVDVGLERSHTFTGLSLTAKTVAYFCTVRAVSVAESFSEGLSNGIYVGYADNMVAGHVDIRPYQSSNTSMHFTVAEYISDFPIVDYQYAITTEEIFINQNLTCDENVGNMTFDILDWTAIGAETLVQNNDLNLIHAHDYYVIAKGIDYAAHCAVNISHRVRVDMTHPPMGVVTVGKLVGTLRYTQFNDRLPFHWDGFEDPESGIHEYLFTLYQSPDCGTTFSEGSVQVVVGPESIFTDDTNATSTEFVFLNLEPNTPYYLKFEAINRAGLSTLWWSEPIFVDTTTVTIGDVIDGDDYETDLEFTPDIENINGVFTIAQSEDMLGCPISVPFNFTSGLHKNWTVVPEIYLPSQRKVNENYLKFSDSRITETEFGVELGILEDPRKRQMINTGIASDPHDLETGPYRMVAQAAAGDHILTCFSFSKGQIPMINYEYPWVEDPPDEEFFDDADEFPNPNDVPTNDTVDVNATAVTEPPPIVTTTIAVTISPVGTYSVVEVDEVQSEEECGRGCDIFWQPYADIKGPDKGFGIAILGMPIFSPLNQTSEYYLVFWAADETVGVKTAYVSMSFDPTAAFHTYTMEVKRVLSGFLYLYDVTVLVDNVPLATLYGMNIIDSGYIGRVYLTNNDEYFSLSDPWNPFETTMLLESIEFAIPKDQLCHFGEPFYDFQSRVDEIWVAVGRENDYVDDVVPWFMYHEECHGCYSDCDEYSCNDTCTSTAKRDLIHVHIANLTLEVGRWREIEEAEADTIATETTTVATSATTETPRNTTYYAPATYFLYLEIKNRADLSVRTMSSGISIDVTPPEILDFICVDPWFSPTEEATEQLANNSLGADWEIEDAESPLQYFYVAGAEMNENDTLEYISEWEQVGVNENGWIISDLELDAGSEYYYVLIAENRAGLQSTASCSILVNNLPINVSNAAAPEVEFADPDLSENLPGDISGTQSQSSMGLTWNPDDVAACMLVAFQASSQDEPETGNIIPEFILGAGEDVIEVVIDGGVVTVLAGNTEKAYTLGELSDADWRNFTSAEWDTQASATDLLLEPGQCIIMEIMCIGANHVYSKLQDTEMCIITDGDEIVTVPSGGVNRRRKKRQAAGNWDIVSPLPEGLTLIEGDIDEETLGTVFDSAASSDYSSYIQHPIEMRESASRLLWNRIHNLTGIAFKIGPAGAANLTEEMILELTVPDDLTITDEQEFALVYWDKGARMFRHAKESCMKNPTMSGSTYTAHICETYTHADEPVRNFKPEYRMSTTMYAGLVIGNKVLNDPPELITDYIEAVEDEQMELQLSFYDANGDSVMWNITQESEKGKAEITEDGWLMYTPHKNRFGNDTIYVKMTETGVPEEIEPLSTMANITIYLDERDDEPQIFLVYETAFNTTVVKRANESDADLVYLNVDASIDTNRIPQSGNITFINVYVIDPDDNDDVDLLSKIYPSVQVEDDTGFTPGQGNTGRAALDGDEEPDLSDPDANAGSGILKRRRRDLSEVLGFNITANDTYTPLIDVEEVTSNQTLLPEFIGEYYEQIRQYQIVVDDYLGIHHVQLLGADTMERFSVQFDIYMFMLQNPCVHGSCVGPEDDPDCESVNRAVSWEGYSCECVSNYYGDFCELGCGCADFVETCVIEYADVNGVEEEVGFECVTDVAFIGALAGGLGGGLILVIIISCAIGVPLYRKNKAKTLARDRAARALWRDIWREQKGRRGLRRGQSMPGDPRGLWSRMWQRNPYGMYPYGRWNPWMRFFGSQYNSTSAYNWAKTQPRPNMLALPAPGDQHQPDPYRPASYDRYPSDGRGERTSRARDGWKEHGDYGYRWTPSELGGRQHEDDRPFKYYTDEGRVSRRDKIRKKNRSRRGNDAGYVNNGYDLYGQEVALPRDYTYRDGDRPRDLREDVGYTNRAYQADAEEYYRTGDRVYEERRDAFPVYGAEDEYYTGRDVRNPVRRSGSYHNGAGQFPRNDISVPWGGGKRSTRRGRRSRKRNRDRDNFDF